MDLKPCAALYPSPSASLLDLVRGEKVTSSPTSEQIGILVKSVGTSI